MSKIINERKNYLNKENLDNHIDKYLQSQNNSELVNIILTDKTKLELLKKENDLIKGQIEILKKETKQLENEFQLQTKQQKKNKKIKSQFISILKECDFFRWFDGHQKSKPKNPSSSLPSLEER